MQSLTRSRRFRSPLFHLLHPLLHGRDRISRCLLYGADHDADLLCRPGGPFGKGANFVGNHGKASPLLTGPGRFNGGIERQEIRLVGNILDCPHDLTYLIGIRPQTGNGSG